MEELIAMRLSTGTTFKSNPTVHAGASGVGMAAIQIGSALGARVIATASTEVKRQFARSQGAELVLDYGSEQWIDHVKDATGGAGADVIYDQVGGDVFEQSTKCIAAEGRLLVIGFQSGRIPTIAAIEGNSRQYCPKGNDGWRDRYPSMFKITDGTVGTACLNEPGLGYSW